VTLALKHRSFREQVDTTLKTDADGRVASARLRHRVIRAQGPRRAAYVPMAGTCASTPRRIMRRPATSSPCRGSATPRKRRPRPCRCSSIAARRRQGLLLRPDGEDGFLQIRDLPPATTRSFSALGTRHRRPRDGRRRGARLRAVAPSDSFEAARLAPLAITDISAREDAIICKIANREPWTRVHVIGARTFPSTALRRHGSTRSGAFSRSGGCCPRRST